MDKSSVYLQQFIDFRLKRGSPDSAPMEDLIFDMLLEEFSDYRMVLQAKFENPLSASIGSKPDVIIARIVNPSIFIGRESGKIVEVAE